MTDYTEFSNEETQVTEEEKENFFKKSKGALIGCALGVCAGIAFGAMGYKIGYDKWIHSKKPVLRVGTAKNRTRVGIRMCADDHIIEGMTFNAETAKAIAQDILQYAEEVGNNENSN